jgi:hypothetical protein
VPKAWLVVPAGSGGDGIYHVGAAAAAAFPAAGLALAAGPAASAPASTAAAASPAAAAICVSRPDAVRLLFIIHPRMVSGCYLKAIWIIHV